jgi:hypothetical protein
MATHVCGQCGQDFEREGDRPYKFCSRACYHHSRVGRSSYPNNRKTAQLVTRTCRQCGNEFESKSSAGARINYCSRWCQSQQRTKAGQDVRTLSTAEAAYLAGLIDGEGSVLMVDRRHKRPGSSHPSIHLFVAGTYLPMHDWISRTTGVGYLYARKEAGTLTEGLPDGKVYKRTKTCYQWAATAANAVAILRQVEPYMIEKRERTLLAIACFEQGYGPYDAATAGADAGAGSGAGAGSAA